MTSLQSPEQRLVVVQQMHDKARAVVGATEKQSEAASASLIELDAELRQFFDILSAQDPVTPAELSILEDVGALLNRAKTLAAEQRKQTLIELKRLNTSRSGIHAYRSVVANH